MTVPAELLRALETGTITEEQLKALITIEAGELDMDFDEAMRLAAQGTLPTGPLGADIEFLAGLLLAA